MAVMVKLLTVHDCIEPKQSELPILQRFQHALRRKYHKILPAKMTRRVNRGGINYALDGRDFAMRRVLKHGAWERENIIFFFDTAQARSAEVFLDIGANFGYYSLIAAKLGTFAEIHAFEPHPETYSLLTTQVAINGWKSVIMTHNIAVSDSQKQMFITSAAVGGARVLDNKSDFTLSIKAAALDSVLDFSGRSIAVKMDVEEHELSALKGMSRLFAKNKVFLQVEVWEKAGISPMNAISWLPQNGFGYIGRIGHDFYFINDYRRLDNGD